MANVPPMPARAPPPMPSRAPPTAGIPPMPNRAPPPETVDNEGSLKEGEAVRAFYNMSDHPSGYRFVRLLDGPPEEAPEPTATGDAKDSKDICVVGLSTGWTPATIAEDWRHDASAEEPRVLVKLHGRFIDPYKQEGPDPIQDMFWRVPRSLIRRTVTPPPELSLFVARWHDYHNYRMGSRCHNVVNEHMLLDVLQNSGSPHEAFGTQGTYEVYSAFIRSTADLSLIGARLSTAMRGQRRAGMYFLWPTHRPASEKRTPGTVGEQELLALMRRMEDTGVRSAWPHDSRFYRELSGKTWPARTCAARPDLRVPLTVEVPFQDFDDDPIKAAEAAIAKLQALTGDSVVDAKSYRGVVKLSFSWQGEHVKAFQGTAQLAKVLAQLFDGATAHAVCLVQQRIENVACEMRYICCRDLASGEHVVQKQLVRMSMKQRSDLDFALTSANTLGQSDALQYCFHGSAEAMAKAEQEGAGLADKWFAWMLDEGYGTPSSCRLDFLVSVEPPQAKGATPAVDVWTVELCECGGSLCDVKCVPRTTAILNDCVCLDSTDGSPPPSGFPKPLPAFAIEVKEPPSQSYANNGTSSNWGVNGNNGTPSNGYGRGARGAGGNSTMMARKKQYGSSNGPSNGPLSAFLAKLGFEGANGGRALLTAVLAVIVMLWLRSRSRR